MKKIAFAKKVFADNRGLTLAELLVGVTILAIIVTPLLHAFITGASTERKGREYGEATVAAKNIMEQVQATDVEKFASLGWSLTGDKYLISNIKTGTSKFDATVELNAVAGDINNDEISFSNSMDAVLDLNGADGEAEFDYIARLQEMDAKSHTDLVREIFITVSKANASYVVNVNFDYEGSYTYTDPNDKNKTLHGAFVHHETATATVTAPKTDTPSFSMYLFYNAYYGAQNNYKINIKNDTGNVLSKTGTDFNVFLVNTAPVPQSYAKITDVVYMNQYDNQSSRVFTNVLNVKYKALDPGSWHTGTITPTGKLVETKVIDRYFDVTINIFKAGETTPIYTMESTKLN